MSDHLGAGVGSSEASIIRRTIVHDYHRREMRTNARHEWPDASTFIEARDDRHGWLSQVHREILADGGGERKEADKAHAAVPCEPAVARRLRVARGRDDRT